MTEGRQPRVSVIMPAYNAAAFIREAMRSVLEQTLRDIELIVVDDASTDDTVAVVESLDDARIALLRLPRNGGAVAARNAGIERAAGCYIALLDADDVALPQRLATQLALLERSGADVCASGYEQWWPADGRTKRGHQYVADADLRALLCVYCPIGNSTVTGKAEVFKTWRYDIRYAHAEDYELWTRMAAHGCVFIAAPQVLVRYRMHRQQTSVRNVERVSAASDAVRVAYLERLGIDAQYAPRKLAWRERLHVAPRLLQSLRERFGPVSVGANCEIYARFQYRGNGLLTPFVRLERLTAALRACRRGNLAPVPRTPAINPPGARSNRAE